jgi:Homeodomain-like domain
MSEVGSVLAPWAMDERAVRERMYRAPTPRERERWHALWLYARGWTAVQVADALERDPHTVGEWLAHFGATGPTGLTFEQAGGPPPPSTRRSGRS